ncbi:MAG TPA: hypothetical protein DCY79_22855, partial [Planctomycetaceae bacterium]|nr:hypothetical protein [Planctomycetaceae bacterium]
MEDQFKVALEIVGGIVQIAIALSPILLARLKRSREGDVSVGRDAESSTPRGKALGVESVAALACGLFVMASVASLLIHVYVTSREGIHPPEAIATSFFISILIGAVTYLAWRWQCMPAVVSVTCISTALASALVYQLWMTDGSEVYGSHGGPRYSYLSVLILFAIGIAYFASIVGSPIRFSPLGLRRTSRMVVGAWVIILLTGVYIAAIETVCQVKFLEREPFVVTAAKHDSASAMEKQRLLDWLRTHQQDAVAIYQFGSEVRLHDYYRQAYKQPIESDYRLLGMKGQMEQQIAREEDEDAVQPVNSLTLLDQLREDPVAGGLPESSVEKTLLSRLTATGPQRNQDVQFMRKRLAWVHPARNGDSRRLPMDKYTAEGRFHRFAMRRQRHAEQCLFGQYRAAYRLDHGMYDTGSVNDAAHDMHESLEDQVSGDLGRSHYPVDAPAQRESSRHAVPTEETYFPGPDDTPGGYVLEKQMTLPTAEEAAIAYRQYVQLVFSALDRDVHGAQKRETLRHYFALSLDQQHALERVFSPRSGGDQRLTVDEKDDLIDFLGDADARETILAEGEIKENGLHEQPELIAVLLQKHQEHEEALHLIETRALVRGEQDFLLATEVHDFLHELRNLGALRNSDGVSEDLSVLQIMENPIQFAIEGRLLSEQDVALQQQVVTATSDREREKLLNNALVTQFRRFCVLTDRDQEAILNEIALSRLFTPAVTLWESPWFYIGRLYSYSWWYAMAVVFGMLYLPMTLGCVVIGVAAARILRKRNELRELIASEDLRADHGQHVALPATSASAMRGRDDFLQRLRHLALRGWGTIAVVGRRGVGKTRV